jgi:hypothetical protein
MQCLQSPLRLVPAQDSRYLRICQLARTADRASALHFL